MPDESDLAPEQEAQLRRLLAQARHDAPIPGDVSARLDRVLAGLREEAPETRTPKAPVVSLEAARRRRRAGALLVAAAVVLLAGIGLGHVLGKNGDRGSSADSASASGSAPDVTSADSAGRTSPTPPSASSPEKLAGRLSQLAPRARLGSADFATQVRRLDSGKSTPASPSAGASDTPTAAAGSPVVPRACLAPGRVGRGRAVPVLYDGAPAALVFRPATSDAQVVDLLRCTDDSVVRSLTLPR